ncbi:methyltransferase [archaeon]|jgi:tRNA (adenine57-N1/adenine58-N1)-methyltransferase catalytic subunit|nr:methyltransferase [archaeon]MBT4397399.1 methyltransferase [archaeon]
MKILLYNSIRGLKTFFWESGDLHTQFGIVKEEDLKKDTNKVKSHAGKEFIIYPANFSNQIKQIKRGPQTLLTKDLAYIQFYIEKDSIVAEAGSGTGLLAAIIAQKAKKVYSYDLNESHSRLAQKNIDYLNIKNIELINKDIYEGIDQEVDTLILDLPEPWKVPLDNIKNGATIIAYLPTITQVMEFHKCNLHIEKTIELLEREWYVQGRRVRPKSQMEGHTAFLIIARKI